MLDPLAKFFRDDTLHLSIGRVSRALVAGYHGIGIDAARNIAAAMVLGDGDREARARDVRATLQDFDTECSRATALQIQATCR